MINALYYKTPKDLNDAFNRICLVKKEEITCLGCPVWEWYKANESFTTDCHFVFAMLDHKKSKRKNGEVVE